MRRPDAMVAPVTLVDDRTPLGLSDAVAAIIVLDDGRYLLQQRDDMPGIWYPGHWGCFGGAVDEGETSPVALARELDEELGLVDASTRPFCCLGFDLRDAGGDLCRRDYFVIDLEARAVDGLELTEGQQMAAMHGDEVFTRIPLTPYDAFALFLYHSRERWLGA